MNYTNYKKESTTITINVTGIEKGSYSEISKIKGATSNMLPYRVKFTITNVGDKDLEYASFHNIELRTSTGQSTSLISIYTSQDCSSASGTFMKGETLAGCQSDIFTTSDTVTKAVYKGGDYGSQEYKNTPITWKQ